jgi:hypothetical protein
MALARLGFQKEKHIPRATPFILIIDALGLPGFHRERRTHIGVQFDRFFIKTHERTGLFVRLGIEFEKVLHRRQKLGRDFWNAPTLD